MFARRPDYFLLSCVLALVCCALTPTSTFAQNVQYTNKAVDLGLRGSQTVNPATLGVEFQIPLGHYRGRAGHDVPVTLSYSSKVWGVEYQGFNAGAPPPHGSIQPFTLVTAEYAEHSVAGWTSSVGFPVLDFVPGNKIYNHNGSPNTNSICIDGCWVVDRMMVWMPDGSGHELRAADQPRAINQGIPQPDNLYSIDGSRMRYQRSTATLFLADGSRFVFPGQYIDRNGNKLTWNGGWRDTLDRQIANPLPYTPGTTPLEPLDQIYSLPGVSSAPINYTLKWRYLADVLTTPQPLRYIADSACPPGNGVYSPHLFSSDHANRTCIANADELFNPVVLSQIVLQNGQSYTFTYDIYGAINKVVLPHGAYEKYQYQTVTPVSSPTTFQWVYAQANRGVNSRIVSATGSETEEEQWQYSAANGNFVSMTAPDGTRTDRYHWVDGVSGWGYSDNSSRAGRAYDEQVWSASGQMVRRKLTEWVMTPSNASGTPGGTQMANRNARITREVRFLLDASIALAKTTTYGYDTTYQYDVGIEQTSISEYDFVEIDLNTAKTLPIASLSSIPNGTLLRTTETDYLTSNANYRDRNLLGLRTATRVRNGAGNIMAQSSFQYDEAALLTYEEAVFGWVDPGTIRGNLTTTSHWQNFNGSTFSTFPAGSFLTIHDRYDQCGSVRKSFDARDSTLSNPAQTDYSSDYHRAYATSTTSPDPDGPGPLVSLQTATEYDLSTGLVTATIDANQLRTTFAYNDPLNRLKQVIRAATDPSVKNQTTYTYNDMARTVTTESDLHTFNDKILVTVTFYDESGRLSETRNYEGGGNYIAVKQKYDELGRVWKTSNPFRPLAGETEAWTITAYDALGRVKTVTTPDNAVVNTFYDGARTFVVDQAGKGRVSVTTALGQLKEVWEIVPPDSASEAISFPERPEVVAGYRTKYDYDVLNNLVGVTQRVGTTGPIQNRSFVYDSLARLVSASNPESGTVAYKYDKNGNLTVRTDARTDPNNSSKKVSSHFAYDALNRLTRRWYNGSSAETDTQHNSPTLPPGVGATAEANYYYDGAVIPTLTPGAPSFNRGASNGRLVAVTYGTGSSAGDYFGYDQIGRPILKIQQIGGNNYLMTAEYNAAGSIKSIKYPSDRVVNYGFEAAGRINNFSGNIGDGGPRTYSSEVTYSPFGGMAKEKFGTTTAIYNKLFYNLRGQLAEVRASTTYTGVTDNSWNRGAIVNNYSAGCTTLEGAACNGTDNNGNLLKQKLYIPHDQLPATVRTQEFSYDSLNRISWARELMNSNEQWRQEFVYDRFGNRTIYTNPAATHGTGTAITAFQVDQSNNRLLPSGQPGSIVMEYDGAGNLTNDTYTGNGSRTYDAENRITSAIGTDGQSQTYLYDASGQRIKRIAFQVETWQVYGFSGELLAEYPPNATNLNPTKEYGYRNGQLLVTAEPNTAAVNVALGANGAVATASSAYDPVVCGSGAVSANDGDRAGRARCNNRVWNDAAPANTFPDWLQIDFNGSKTITEIDVITVQDHLEWPVESTEAMTFSQYGLTAYEVQYWNNSTWVTIPGGSVSGNNKVWRKFTFSTITTTKIRVLASASPDGYSRIVELEAWTGPSPAPRHDLALGATATASTSYSGWGPSAVVNGDRKSLNAYSNGAWSSSAANNFPEWVQVDFGANKTISEIQVFTLQDNWAASTEPTAAMTFTMYGLSGYEVQYWTGSSWVTVPGGSVTGNNKIWKTFTFSPITTSKIRVLTNASPDGVSRVTEIEAYAPTDSVSAGVHWLVTDHLGTPRMILDQTGDLANMTRHDYLPFGEEIPVGVSGRTGGPNGQGFGNGDGVRQQLTLKERDVETGLDYFGARYYSPTQGRFVSCDLPLMDQFPQNPQSWNLYSYTRNNPVRVADKDGHITPWDVLDIISLAMSINDFVKQPSWANAGWLAGDAIGAAAPFLPFGSVRRAAELRHLLDASASVKHLENGTEIASFSRLSKEGTIIATGQDNIRSAVGITDGSKVADFLTMTGPNKFVITESKGVANVATGTVDVDRAVSQLENTAKHLVQNVKSAEISRFEIAMNVGSNLGPAYKKSGDQLLKFDSAANQWKPFRIMGKVVHVVEVYPAPVPTPLR